MALSASAIYREIANAGYTMRGSVQQQQCLGEDTEQLKRETGEGEAEGGQRDGVVRLWGAKEASCDVESGCLTRLADNAVLQWWGATAEHDARHGSRQTRCRAAALALDGRAVRWMRCGGDGGKRCETGRGDVEELVLSFTVSTGAARCSMYVLL